METKKKAALIIDFIFIVFFAAVIYLFLKYCIVYLLPFLVSFLFVYSLQKPMILISQKTRIPKGVLTVLALILLISAFIALCYAASLKIIEFTVELFSEGHAGSIISKNNLIYSLNALISFLPRSLKESLNISPQSIISTFGGYFGDFIKSLAASVITSLPGFLVSCVVSVVSACFLAFDYDNIINFVKRQLSPNAVKHARSIKRIINFSIFSLLKGYFIIMLITFSEMLLGFMILGIDNAVALALIVAFVDVLPIFGTGTVLIPWGVIEIVSGNESLGISILVLYGVSAVARYFIEPKIIGKKFGINPLISLASLFIGLKLFGFLGMILFPILVSVIVILQKNGQIKLWK